MNMDIPVDNPNYGGELVNSPQQQQPQQQQSNNMFGGTSGGVFMGVSSPPGNTAM